MVSFLRAGALASVALFAGCDDNPFATRSGDQIAAQQAPLELEERDIEAPAVFNYDGPALWDGRPSLGGVWAALKGDVQPERVIIRNAQNGRSVVGALFRRDESSPGPDMTISSDAAAAIGLQAGVPTAVTVTALRRQPVPVAAPVDAPAEAPISEAPAGEVEEVALDAPAGDDTAELLEAAVATAPEPAAATEVETTPPPAAPTGPAPRRPLIQVGTFGVESNADGLISILGREDIDARVVQEGSLYRVLAGPAATVAERDQMLAKVRAIGFGDAFAVPR